ncbi:hypothetical protein CD351_14440 [Erythrobacter sp. KY5]|uniref:hypothetical protein n=1 Tax=Erythrobacter sp. KY5 TaxID=2011159 RepID=UPI000DBEF88F|nr:hypothetical protein [Erythrobacter sp. KY5]AWW75632.1 hypothetical protein CD351_14440 [Erythrobacter sp. KY5]
MRHGSGGVRLDDQIAFTRTSIICQASKSHRFDDELLATVNDAGIGKRLDHRPAVSRRTPNDVVVIRE